MTEKRERCGGKPGEPKDIYIPIKGAFGKGNWAGKCDGCPDCAPDKWCEHGMEVCLAEVSENQRADTERDVWLRRAYAPVSAWCPLHETYDRRFDGCRHHIDGTSCVPMAASWRCPTPCLTWNPEKYTVCQSCKQPRKQEAKCSSCGCAADKPRLENAEEISQPYPTEGPLYCLNRFHAIAEITRYAGGDKMSKMRLITEAEQLINSVPTEAWSDGFSNPEKEACKPIEKWIAAAYQFIDQFLDAEKK